MPSIHIRLTDEQYKLLEDLAKQEELPVATWARAVLLKLAKKNTAAAPRGEENK